MAVVEQQGTKSNSPTLPLRLLVVTRKYWPVVDEACMRLMHWIDHWKSLGVDVQVTGGYATTVGRSANQANPQWHIKTTDQIRKHHDRAGHNRHNRDWVLSVLAAKGRAKLLDPLSDRLLIEKYFHERMR